MPSRKRYKTKYAGVYFVDSVSPSGKAERVYFIRYRKDGKMIEEKAGRQFADDMTPARAATKRGQRIDGDQVSNTERRAIEEIEKNINSEKWTISKLWQEYFETRPDLKGAVTDENRFKNHIEPIFGKKEPSELLPLDVDRLRLSLLKKKSPGTVKNVLELLRRIINFGVKKNLCAGLNFTVELPRVNNEKTEDLTPEQLQCLLKAIDADSNIQAGSLMKMILFTGLRRSELFRLQWDQVDFEKSFILIKDPKGGIDQRIPLNEAARDLLLKHPRLKKSPYIFPGRKGRQRKDIKHQVNRIKEAAGIPKDFRALHGLRHVYASMLASSGKVDMYTLQKLLTHKSPVMTQRYAHLRDDAMKDASNVAGDIISKAASETSNVVDMGTKKKG
jgi:integrase